jgi:hypothetical protein
MSSVAVRRFRRRTVNNIDTLRCTAPHDIGRDFMVQFGKLLPRCSQVRARTHTSIIANVRPHDRFRGWNVWVPQMEQIQFALLLNLVLG